MAEEVLVKEQLSSDMIAAGGELTNRLLNHSDFALICSLWLYRSESNRWKLVVATPIVDSSGPIHAYQMIQGIVGEDGPGYLDLPLYSISVLGSDHSLVRALRSLGHFQIQELSRGPRSSPSARAWKKVELTRVQDVFIEDALIYYIE